MSLLSSRSPVRAAAAPKAALGPLKAMIVLFALLALVLASCGDDTSAPAGDEGESELPSDEGEAPPPVVGAGESSYQPTGAMLDMIDRKPHPIDDVVVSVDGMTLAVRYMAASEPCSGAIASVVEDNETVTVTLEAGLNPQAAAMTCVAQIMPYELAVPLEAPVGSREIVTE